MKRFVLFLMVIAAASLCAVPLRAQDYTLGPDDLIKVTVYGEKDLSAEYKVGADGSISMPLIGGVRVSELTPAAAEQAITQKLADGYLVDPSVTIQVIEARPFYILGEVKNPGSYKFVTNMTALNAVALAGGYTYRASEGSVRVMRGPEEIKIEPEEKILPGDIITVRERFF